MAVVAQCPRCGARYEVRDEAIGRQAKCRQCGDLFVLKAAGAAQAAPASDYELDAPPPGMSHAGAALAAATHYDRGYEEDIGVYRNGTKLVMEIGADLPDLCVKTGLPADGGTIRRKLMWHEPALYALILLGLLPYAIIALAVSKKATVDFPISKKVRDRRNVMMTIAWILFAAAFGIGIYICSLMDKKPNRDDTIGMLFAVAGVLFLASLILAALVSGSLPTPTRIDRDYITLKGVSPKYLDQLKSF